MSLIRLIYLFLILIFCVSCSKEVVEKSKITETNLELQTIEAYQEGLKELKKGDVLFAAKKFNEAEMLYPQSMIAPRSALMASYSYYSQNYYSDAIAELDRFLKVYPNYKDKVYAEYLLALCYYEAKISSGKIYELAEVVRDLNKGDDILVDQSYSERQLFEKAYERLLTEFQIVMNSTLEDAQKKLDKALKRNLQSQTQKIEEVPKVKENQEEISEEAQQ